VISYSGSSHLECFFKMHLAKFSTPPDQHHRRSMWTDTSWNKSYYFVSKFTKIWPRFHCTGSVRRLSHGGHHLEQCVETKELKRFFPRRNNNKTGCRQKSIALVAGNSDKNVHVITSNCAVYVVATVYFVKYIPSLLDRIVSTIDAAYCYRGCTSV